MGKAIKSDWKTFDLPAMNQSIPLQREFSLTQIERIMTGLIPEQMEDKWFICWENEKLFFHRSWTGYCVYVAHFEADGDTYRLTGADVNRDPEQYVANDADRDARMINYLIDVLLLGVTSEFPSDQSDPKLQALQQWSQVGRAMLGEHPGQPRTKDA